MWRLTFELSGRRRQDARPGLAKMYTVPPARAWWPAVGAPLERGVRPHFTPCDALALAVAPLLLAGDSILVAVHLHPGAVGEKVLRFGTRLHL